MRILSQAEAVHQFMEYYIRVRGEVQGPFRADQLQKLATRGRFSRHYEVSDDEQRSWQRADAFPELFPQVSAPVRPATEQPAAPTVQPTSVVPAQAAAQPELEQWYYTHDGAECGPVSKSELQRMLAAGQVIPEDHVWFDGMESWQRVRDVPDLVRSLSSRLTAAEVRFAIPREGPESAAGMAIASLVFGLLGITILPLLGSVLAIIFGHIALGQIQRSNGRKSGRGLAVSGLILGYLFLICFVIIVLVFAVLVGLTPSL